MSFASSDVIVLEIEVKGSVAPFQILLEPYALIIPGENYIGLNVKKDFKVRPWLLSPSPGAGAGRGRERGEMCWKWGRRPPLTPPRRGLGPGPSRVCTDAGGARLSLYQRPSILRAAGL